MTTQPEISLLHRAITISLFTWRLAQPDDVPPNSARQGWWGDTFPTVANDRIGSRLWLLQREKLTAHTQQRALEYAREALQWLTQDGHAQAVEVNAARQGLSTLILTVRITLPNGHSDTFDYPNTWQTLHV